ncbi:hypothetical protein Tco_1001696, partial [Tanacetum coccineum]
IVQDQAKKRRANPEEVFSDYKIVEVVRANKSYQVEINLIDPTLTFPGIKACNPYSIIDEPSISLIYFNNKEEKSIIDLVDIPNFCDATLEKVLKEVKLKIFETEFKMKPPLLDGLELKIMKVYEREIEKLLKHRKHMRRWESFVN